MKLLELFENFADGKGPGRPGDSQRHGIPKGATMAELEKASHAKGRKGQLARWQLNMRRGHKKESIAESISGEDMLKLFHQTHHAADENPEMEKWMQDHEWGIKMIHPDSLPDIDDEVYFDDPFNRVMDIDTDHVRDVIRNISRGGRIDPIIMGPSNSIIDGNHRAQAARRLGIDIQAYVNEADWKNIKRVAKGAVAGAGLVGAAALGWGDKPAEKPVQQPVAIAQPAQQDSIPASMFNPNDLPASKSIASTAQSANPNVENMLIKIATSNSIRGDELAAFLAQTAHESSSFSRLNEIGNEHYFKAKYDIQGRNPELARRLGNVNPGDGVLYHGRGFVHLTGRTNYRIAGEALGLPLEKKPRLAADPEIAAKIAIWFWNTRVRPNVEDWDDVRSVTRKINSGMAGLDDRQNNYDFYRKKLSSAPKLAQR